MYSNVYQLYIVDNIEYGFYDLKSLHDVTHDVESFEGKAHLG